MSDAGPADAGGFLRRWSLRKQAVRAAEAEPDVATEAEVEPAAHGSGIGELTVPEPASEPATPDLPDIETLDGSSDYRGFLDRAVPRDLRVAALRKAWATDPAIADYRPLADYDWDFNAPGYAALRPTDDPEKFVTALFRHLQPAEPETGAEPAGAGADSPDAAASPARNHAPAPGFDGYPQIAEKETGMALTLDEIRAVLGPVDPQVAAEIVRLDPDMADLQAAKAWMLADEALANDHRSPPSGNVARLIDLLASQGLQDPDETDGAPLA